MVRILLRLNVPSARLPFLPETSHGFMKNAPNHFLSEEYFIFHEFLIMVLVFNEY